MVKGSGLVMLVLALSLTSTGFRDTSAPADDAAPAPRAGPAVGPLDVVTSSVARGLASLSSPRPGWGTCDARRPEIRRAADDLFDVDDIARRALGRHWKSLGPREQEEFVGLFRGVLTQSFVAIVERYTGDDAMSVTEAIAGTFAQVHSRIAPEHGAEITIEYRLSRRGPQWAVYDVVLDGVSLVSNYRSQFNALLGASSVAGLLERMRAEPSRCLPSPAVVAGATTAAPEPSARERLAAGVLLGAASYARRGR
jgi:phospholipid transport system substrate-binding protein